MARARPELPPKPPWWHRSRLGWVNALGFALTLFLGLWLLLFAAANLLPDAEPFRFGFPTVFAIVLFVTHAVTVALGAVVVFGFMWRGADFHAHKPRLYVFFWNCAGLLFALVQMVILLKFDWPELPNVARFARQVYWGEAYVGLLCFGVMAYVNIDIPSADSDAHHDGDDYDDGDYGDHYDDEHD
ncbi:MAG: hypothetical protein O2894_00170 [Planctomycetota bacterium]|nr:hypothetical protein [Planctomycetota bacterium]